MIKNLVSNWKTTSAGLGMFVTGAVHLVFVLKSKTATESDITTTIITMLGGIGLLAAGDASKSAPAPAPETEQKPPAP